jgi:hypothetical protein
MKGVQATGEAFSPQMRTSYDSKHKIQIFSIFSGNFLPSADHNTGSQLSYGTRHGWGQERWIHRFTSERWFFCEENKGFIVIGTFYFNGALNF